MTERRETVSPDDPRYWLGLSDKEDMAKAFADIMSEYSKRIHHLESVISRLEIWVKNTTGESL